MARGRSVPALTALLFGASCAWPSPERQLLLDFFQACRNYDTTVMARLATVSCNPRADALVREFEIVDVRDANPAGGARELTLDATVRPPAGPPETRMLTVRMEEIGGRWMVTAIRPLRASQTSPAGSSARPR